MAYREGGSDREFSEDVLLSGQPKRLEFRVGRPRLSLTDQYGTNASAIGGHFTYMSPLLRN